MNNEPELKTDVCAGLGAKRIIAVHQPNFIPWIGFFHKIVRSDIFVLLDSVQFSKENFINRAKIKLNGSPFLLSVPVLTKGRLHQSIQETKINELDNWRKKHLKSIEYGYKKSSFFNDYYHEIEEIYNTEHDSLAGFNIKLIERISELMGIKTKFIRSSELPVSGTRNELLINLCKALNAEIYLSGQGATKYLDEALFGKEKIDVVYQNFIHPTYNQLGADFIAGLSILDLLFNNGKKSIEYLTNGR